MAVLLTRRGALAFGAAALGASVAFPARAAETITLIVPFPPGGAVDLVARMVAEKLGPALGATMIVENRGGAGGMIGASAVAKADPDGRTLGLLSVSQLVANKYLYPQMPYDPDRDLTPISRVTSGTLVCVVNSKAAEERGWRTFRDLIAWSKANPNEVRMGSSGPGQASHLAIELVKARTGAAILHVPYKGGGPAITDLLGRTIDMMFDVTPALLPHVREGRFKALAVASRERLTALPDVPSMAEFSDIGLGDVDVATWYALAGPKGLPPEIQEKVRAALAGVMADGGVLEKLAPTGFVAAVDPSPEALKQRMAEENPVWKEMVRISGATLE